VDNPTSYAYGDISHMRTVLASKSAKAGIVSIPQQTAAPAALKISLRELWPLLLVGTVVAAVAQLIGVFKFNIGMVSMTFYPMVWAILIGLALSVQKIRPMGFRLQRAANVLVATAVLFLVIRLAFNVGPNLKTLIGVGPGLLLQEVGHLLGTIVLALPLAVLLKMGKSTIGATFSIDREPAFAMVNERYGPDSDQYRGVLAMYIFGALFGALYITILTSVIVSLGWLDPLALAMGAGVGSGSMMAASAASIVAAHPELESQILSVAAVSNLITTIAGVYVGIYVALPLADRFYHFLTRRQKATVAPVRSEAQVKKDKEFIEMVAASSEPVHVNRWIPIAFISLACCVTASIAKGGFSPSIPLGVLVMVALVVIGLWLAKVTRKISAVVWITTMGALLSSPWSPVSEQLVSLVSSVDFMSLVTVVLTCAGLSLGKDLPLLRRIGWKIVPVGIVAVTASFLLSSLIAEFALGLWS
jgi:hypothetical protein